MKIQKTIISTLLVIASQGAIAQTIQNFDAEPRVELLGSNLIPPGTLRLAKATFINNGPGIYPLVSSVSTVFTELIGSRTIAIVRVPETAPCDIFSQDFGPTILTSIFGPGNGPTAPGQVECIFGIVTFSEAPAEFSQTFTASFSNDLNPANNRFDVVIRTQEVQLVETVPALNAGASILLAATCLLFGMMVSRKLLV